MANVRLVDLTKHYKRGSEVIKAVDGVTLDIDKGEFIAVVGRSGSGKTTMLDLLGLLLKPTAGSLFIDDVDTAKLGDRDRAHMRALKVGFVFQEYNLLSGLNVLENVMLPLRYVKNGKDGKQRAVELIERVGLTDRIKHRPTELSGGQMQRVAIARSMVNRPSLILLDEPTGAVDTETAAQLVELLKRLNTADQVTIVLVTPDNCCPGPCVKRSGYTLWISNVRGQNDIVRMTVKCQNSSVATYASRDDLQLIDAGRRTSIPITGVTECNTFARHEFSGGKVFGPINICFRVSNATPPFILHWTPDLGTFCC